MPAVLTIEFVLLKLLIVVGVFILGFVIKILPTLPTEHWPKILFGVVIIGTGIFADLWVLGYLNI
jgi:hypothetical protein